MQHQAGTGEPVRERVLGGARFPVQWRDESRMAMSRAILAATSDRESQGLAALHLLYSSNQAERIQALTCLRDVDPRPPATVEHLASQLQDEDDLLVREFITTLGMIGPGPPLTLP